MINQENLFEEMRSRAMTEAGKVAQNLLPRGESSSANDLMKMMGTLLLVSSRLFATAFVILKIINQHPSHAAKIPEKEFYDLFREFLAMDMNSVSSANVEGLWTSK